MTYDEAITIRDAVYDKIVADASGYNITDLQIEKTYYPRATLQALTEKAHVKVVGMSFGADLQGQLRAPKAILLSLGVQIAVQKKVNPNRFEEGDDIVLLTGHVMNSCIDHELVSGASYLFERIEQMKDENGTPYSYEDLTENGVFNSIFTAYYQHMRQIS